MIRRRFQAGDTVAALIDFGLIEWELPTDEAGGYVARSSGKLVRVEELTLVELGTEEGRAQALRQTIAAGGFLAEVAALQREAEAPSLESAFENAPARFAIILGSTVAALGFALALLVVLRVGGWL